MTEINQLEQPVGDRVAGRSPRQPPVPRVTPGQWHQLESLGAERHPADLFDADWWRGETGQMWTHLPDGPFADHASYRHWVANIGHREDPLLFALVPGNSRASGAAALQRVDPQIGNVDVGHLAFIPTLQGSGRATEAIALLAPLVFDELGYRR